MRTASAAQQRVSSLQHATNRYYFNRGGYPGPPRIVGDHVYKVDGETDSANARPDASPYRDEGEASPRHGDVPQLKSLSARSLRDSQGLSGRSAGAGRLSGRGRNTTHPYINIADATLSNLVEEARAKESQRNTFNLDSDLRRKIERELNQLEEEEAKLKEELHQKD